MEIANHDVKGVMPFVLKRAPGEVGALVRTGIDIGIVEDRPILIARRW